MRQTGRIKTLVSNRGFGFVSTDTGKDLFLHSSACEDGVFDTLEVGDLLTFESDEQEDGRLRAIDARPEDDDE